MDDLIDGTINGWPVRRAARMLYIPRNSNWQVRQSEKTLTYEIKLDFVDRTNTSAATLQIFPEMKKRRELESVCAAMAEALRRGTCSNIATPIATARRWAHSR